MSVALAGFGSYTAGGRLWRTEGEPRQRVRFTRDTGYDYDPNGLRAVEHAYVQYWRPEGARDLPPVVLVHGGGMTGAMWEGTPDGRPGWLHHLLDRRREVHVVDLPERGRAGWAPGLWEGRPILRTLEEAWSLFRIGPPDGFAARRPWAGSRFPVASLEALARSFVPRWTSTAAPQAAALAAVIERLGAADVICHSQGSEAVWTASAAVPGAVRQVLAVEPSAWPAAGAATPPARFVWGDNLDCDGTWQTLVAQARQTAGAIGAAWLDLGATGLRGHTHLPMHDRGNAAALAAALGD